MAFTGNYDEYFGMATDGDAVVYLMLVNSLLHDLWPSHAITIGEDVFIGARAFVLPGISIGARAVIGACSVVTRDIPPGMVATGNPATSRRERKIRS